MFVKIHKGKNFDIVSVCDEELVGKKFSDGKLELDVDERFYKGEKMDEDQVKKVLKGVICSNLVGEKIIRLALEMGIIADGEVIKIGGIPHAQSLIL